MRDFWESAIFILVATVVVVVGGNQLLSYMHRPTEKEPTYLLGYAEGTRDGACSVLNALGEDLTNCRKDMERKFAEAGHPMNSL